MTEDAHLQEFIARLKKYRILAKECDTRQRTVSHPAQ